MARRWPLQRRYWSIGCMKRLKRSMKNKVSEDNRSENIRTVGAITSSGDPFLAYSSSDILHFDEAMIQLVSHQSGEWKPLKHAIVGDCVLEFFLPHRLLKVERMSFIEGGEPMIGIVGPDWQNIEVDSAHSWTEWRRIWLFRVVAYWYQSWKGYPLRILVIDDDQPGRWWITPIIGSILPRVRSSYII